MNRRERIALTAAAVVSLAVHGVVAFQIRDMEIGRIRPQLFEQITEQHRQPMEVMRSVEDLIVTDESLDAVERTARLSAEATEEDEAALRELLEQLSQVRDAMEQADDEPPPPVDEAQLDPVAADAPPPPPAPVGDGPDLTDALMALGQPPVLLPEYTAATDEVHAESPDAAKALIGLSRIDPSKVDDLLGTGLGEGGGGVDGGQLGGVPGGKLGGILGGTGNGLPDDALADIGAGAAAPDDGGLFEVDEGDTTIWPDPTETADQLTEAPDAGPEPVHLDQDFDYALHAYRPSPRESGWFEVRISPRHTLNKLQTLQKDVVYVIDTSGSIGDQWIGPIRSGVASALDSLNAGDRFNIVMFKDKVQVFRSEGLAAADDATVAAARQFLKQAESSGWTDVNRALGRIIMRDIAPDRVYQIVLITDGRPTRGAIHPRQIINVITRENNLAAAIFCVGVGERVNRQLLDFLAYRNKGYVVYAEHWIPTPTVIRELASHLRYPIMKDATFIAAGVDRRQVYPRVPHDVYQSEPFSLFGRFDRLGKFTMRVAGRSGKQMLDFTFMLDLAQAQPGDKQLPKDWAFWKLHHLYSEMIRQGETDALKQQIEQIRKRYKLKTMY